MGALFTALATVAAMLPSQAPQPQLPDADPALWVLQDEDTTIYLFGTFHTLDGRSEWFNDEVRSAFVRSDELILETLLPHAEPTAPTTRSIRGYGIASSASFLGTTRMAVSASRNRGLAVEKGADMVLRRAAEDSGKPVHALEPIEFQMRMLSRMSVPPLRAASSAGRDDELARSLGAVMSYMQAAWNRGDQTVFTSMLDQMRHDTPDNYRLMFPQRNAVWADWVAHRLERPGTSFVAVGAGHFAGPDSLLANLTGRGLTAVRIN